MASLSIEQMREALKKAYGDNRKWKLKVNRMSDGQVTAFYLRLKQQEKV